MPSRPKPSGGPRDCRITDIILADRPRIFSQRGRLGEPVPLLGSQVNENLHGVAPAAAAGFDARGSGAVSLRYAAPPSLAGMLRLLTHGCPVFRPERVPRVATLRHPAGGFKPLFPLSSLQLGLQAPGVNEVIQRRPGHAGNLGNRTLGYAKSQKMTDLLLLAVKTRDPQRALGATELLARRPGLGETFSRVRSEIKSRSTSANRAKSVVITLLWRSCLPSIRICSLMAMKAMLSLASASSIATIWPSERPRRDSSLTTSRSPGLRTSIKSSRRRRLGDVRAEAVASTNSSTWRPCLRAYSRIARRWPCTSWRVVETRR